MSDDTREPTPDASAGKIVCDYCPIVAGASVDCVPGCLAVLGTFWRTAVEAEAERDALRTRCAGSPPEPSEEAIEAAAYCAIEGFTNWRDEVRQRLKAAYAVDRAASGGPLAAPPTQKLWEENSRLREMVLRYGRHEDGCASNNPTYPAECDCLLRTILSRGAAPATTEGEPT